jgi:centrosomal protein CEP104
VAQLEARKRAAVEREDYDLAKALKSDIDKLRAAGDGAAMSEAGPPGGNGGGPGALGGGGGGGRVGDDVIARVLGKTRSVGPGGAAGGGGGGGIGAHLGAEPSGAGLDGDGAPAGPPSPGGGLPGGGEASAGVLGGGGGWAGEADGSGIVGAPASMMRRNSGYYAYEERPAVARGALALASEGGGGGAPGFGDEAGLVDADPSAVSAAALFGGSGGGGGPGSGATVEAPAPPGWPQELPPPEPVAGAAAKEAEAVAELAGDYVAAAFFSRNWQLRDAGIAWVTDLVRNGKVRGDTGPCDETFFCARPCCLLGVRWWSRGDAGHSWLRRGGAGTAAASARAASASELSAGVPCDRRCLALTSGTWRGPWRGSRPRP